MRQTNNTAANDEAGENTSWDELRGVIQGRWSELTGEDLDRLKGRVNRLVTLVQERYNVSVDDARRQVSEFESTLEDRARKLYQAASEGVGTRYRAAREGVNGFADDIRNFGLGASVVDLARTYPVATMVTAFLLGAAVGGGGVRSMRRRRWY